MNTWAMCHLPFGFYIWFASISNLPQNKWIKFWVMLSSRCDQFKWRNSCRHQHRHWDRKKKNVVWAWMSKSVWCMCVCARARHKYCAWIKSINEKLRKFVIFVLCAALKIKLSAQFYTQKKNWKLKNQTAKRHATHSICSLVSAQVDFNVCIIFWFSYLSRYSCVHCVQKHTAPME